MRITKKILSLVCSLAMVSAMFVSVAHAEDTTMGVVYNPASTDTTLILDVVADLDDTLHTTGYSFTLDFSGLEGYVTFDKANFGFERHVVSGGANNLVAANKTYVVNYSQNAAEDPIVFADGKVATFTIALNQKIDQEIVIPMTKAKVSYYDWDLSKTASYEPGRTNATIPAPQLPPPPPATTPAAVEITANAGANSAAGAYTFYYATTVTKGDEDITAVDVVVETGDKARKAILDSGLFALLDGSFTFYVGNTTTEAGATFDATATVVADTTVTDTASYTVQ